MQFHRPSTRRGNQSGFALLFIFFLAGSVSIMLFMAMPRVAFESQRDREQMLVDRGEQFKRAIQVYYAKTKKFPQRIEDLENTNNVRFLRRRYVDPMTGKDEWRIIHVNTAGQLTDSLVQKAPGLDPAKEKDQLASASPGNPADAGQDLNAFARQRPSDRTPGANPNFAGGFPGGAPQDPNALQWNNPSALQNPGSPGQYPGQVQAGITGYPQQGNPGAPGQQQFPGGALGGPQAFQPGAQINGTGNPGFPAGFPQSPQGNPYPGAPANSQTGGVSPFQPGTVPFPQPGTQINGAPPGAFGGGLPQGGFPGGPGTPNPAIGLINQIITTPRQNPAAATAANANQFGAGGIAGFASTFSGTGIKVYKDRKKYQEWEFVFDLKELLGQQNKGLPTNNNPLGRPGTPGAPPAPGQQQQQQQQQQQGGFANPNGFTFGGGSGGPPRP